MQVLITYTGDEKFMKKCRIKTYIYYYLTFIPYMIGIIFEQYTNMIGCCKYYLGESNDLILISPFESFSVLGIIILCIIIFSIIMSIIMLFKNLKLKHRAPYYDETFHISLDYLFYLAIFLIIFYCLSICKIEYIQNPYM